MSAASRAREIERREKVNAAAPEWAREQLAAERARRQARADAPPMRVTHPSTARVMASMMMLAATARGEDRRRPFKGKPALPGKVD